MTLVIEFLLIAVLALYILFIFWMSLNFPKREMAVRNDKHEETRLVVIIPFRNEITRLETCISSLLKQKESLGGVKVYLADDHSEDGSTKLAHKYADKSEMILYYKVKGENGKKDAIEEVFNMTSAQLYAVVDADVELHEDWLENLLNHYQNEKFDYLAMPVVFKSEKGLFNALQRLEFVSLIATSVATIHGGKVLMSNGANHAFSSEAFEKVKGFEGNRHVRSGDDLFLLFKIFQNKKMKISYLWSKKSIGETHACPDWNSFMQQRIRWAGKTAYYKNTFAKLTSYLVLLINLLIIVSSLLVLSGKMDVVLLVTLLFLKLISDAFFLIRPLKFFGMEKLLALTPLLLLLYPIYVLVVGVGVLFLKPKWKGRNLINPT